MAITGRFEADFRSFFEATQQAEVSLRSFETGAGKVEGALNRMVDQFSGRKVIQDAGLMTEAVGRLQGGVASLTDGEFARLQRTVGEATDKMKRLGIEVPPEIAKIAGEMRALEQPVAAAGEQFIGTVKTMAGALLGAFSVRAITEEFSRLTEAGGRITDLAAQIGVGTEAVQRLKFAAEQSGTTVDAVATAIRTMAGHLTDGDKGAVAALDALNLDLDALRQMKPDEAFVAIAEAIKHVPEPMRQSALAVDLFGKSGGELLPAIKEGIKEVGDAAPVMRDATVAAFDAAGDKWAEAQGKLNALKANALGPLVDMFLKMPSDLQVVAGGIAAFTPSLESIGLAIMAAGGPSAAFAALKTSAIGVATYLGGGFAAASAGFITFFTATIPAAFGAIMPFLGPIGLIAAGVIGAVAIWKQWDTIGPIVQGVYTTVKTWLVDRFQAVMVTVKGYIDTILGWWQALQTTLSSALTVGAVSPSGGVIPTGPVAPGPWSGGPIPNFSRGTNGVVDFGRGTLAMLHGREAVVPEGRGMGHTVNVTVQANNSFYDSASGRSRLGEEVGRAIMARVR